MDQTAVSKNIKKGLEEKGETARWLAAKVGVTDVCMIRWLAGKRQPTAYGLYKIAKALDTTMEALMDGVDGEDQHDPRSDL